jgi:hypothetical protein
MGGKKKGGKLFPAPALRSMHSRLPLGFNALGFDVEPRNPHRSHSEKKSTRAFPIKTIVPLIAILDVNCFTKSLP